MKKILLIFFAFLFAQISKGQLSYTDSLLQVIRSSKDAQKRLETARFYTWYYAYENDDSVYYCGMQLLRIGQELDYIDMQALGKSYISYSYRLKGKIKDATTLIIESLKLAEQKPNDLLYSFLYNMLGNLYDKFDVEKTIQYRKKALLYVENENSLAANIQKRSLLINLGGRFRINGQFDSALIYLNRANEISMQIKHASIMPEGGLNSQLGWLYLQTDQPQLALTYFKADMEKALKFNHSRPLGQALEDLGEYYINTDNFDSAWIYFNKLDSFSKRVNNHLWDEDLTHFMYKIYKNRSNDGDALHYLEMNIAIKDKKDSIAQEQRAQGLLFDEEMRQQELENEKAKKLEDRKHNLQYAGIASGLVSFIILFLLFSHSIIANQKLIRFLGVMTLLIVFEFLNLFLHPYLDGISNHSPLLMLFAMVCIAALLIPLHHKIQHWVTHKLVEKNNRIRLAAAKKTIEKLEKSNDMTTSP